MASLGFSTKGFPPSGGHDLRCITPTNGFLSGEAVKLTAKTLLPECPVDITRPDLNICEGEHTGVFNNECTGGVDYSNPVVIPLPNKENAANHGTETDADPSPFTCDKWHEYPLWKPNTKYSVGDVVKIYRVKAGPDAEGKYFRWPTIGNGQKNAADQVGGWSTTMSTKYRDTFTIDCDVFTPRGWDKQTGKKPHNRAAMEKEFGNELDTNPVYVKLQGGDEYPEWKYNLHKKCIWSWHNVEHVPGSNTDKFIPRDRIIGSRNVIDPADWHVHSKKNAWSGGTHDPEHGKYRVEYYQEQYTPDAEPILLRLKGEPGDKHTTAKSFQAGWVYSDNSYKLDHGGGSIDGDVFPESENWEKGTPTEVDKWIEEPCPGSLSDNRSSVMYCQAGYWKFPVIDNTAGGTQPWIDPWDEYYKNKPLPLHGQIGPAYSYAQWAELK